jgi:hypothetical protein
MWRDVYSGASLAFRELTMLNLTLNGHTYHYYYTSPESLSTWLTWLQRQTAQSAAA